MISENIVAVIKADAYGDTLHSFVQGLIKITDVSEKQFPSLQSARDRFDSYLKGFWEG